MKKRLIISFMLVVVIIALSTAFIPFKDNGKIKAQTNLLDPEVGYIENIGR